MRRELARCFLERCVRLYFIHNYKRLLVPVRKVKLTFTPKKGAKLKTATNVLIGGKS